MAFKVISCNDLQWDELFEALPYSHKDVFFTSGFAQLCQKFLYINDEVQCAIWKDAYGNLLMYPFVLRHLRNIIDDSQLEGFFDTTSLYGRGGMVGEAGKEVREQFYIELKKYFDQVNVFCSFDRFHPLMENHLCISGVGNATEIGGFVVVDLRGGIDNIDDSFKSSVRKDVKKALRNGVEWFCENSTENLAEFLKIYYATMDRNNASDFHYFPKNYFSNLEGYLKEDFLFFYAVFKGQVVSCELVLLHGAYAHSFLGGTIYEALPLAANPLLKKSIIETVHSKGCDYYLLGGGYQPNDGIFNYKKAYAPNGIYPSYIGGTIWNQDLYDKVKSDLVNAGHEIALSRFQFYDI